ncbi:MAG: hypothetical protein UHU19_07265 [Lachnospiraceae bacterium]|nr:hypothetical protein [Lachnospiraceae bacterium]
MAGIQTSVSVRDGMSAQFATMTRSINVCLGAFMDMQEATGRSVNASSFNEAREAMQTMNAAAEDVVDSIRRSEEQQERLNQSARSGQSAFGDLASKVKGLVAAYVGLSAIKNVVASGIEYASDLSEWQNVVDVSFGNSAQKINEWSQTTLDAFGLNELSAKKYAGTMGAMLKSSGIAGDEVADMAMKITELSGDMASFYNLDNESAFEKIRSGISGETEPLKQLGINMSVANLEAYAMAQGIDKSYDSMTQAEQTLLRYNYLLSVTGDAQGDFARTSDSFANQQKLLKENFLEFAGSIASSVLPQLAELMATFNGVISGLSEHADVFIGIANIAVEAITEIVDGAMWLGTTISENWSIIAPIIMGITTALLIYHGAILALNIAEGIHNAIQDASTFKATVHSAALAMQTGATFTATAAQYGLNAALLACPITWIILAIIAVIAVIYAVVAAINKVQGTTISATGIIFGVITTVAAAIANVALGITNFIIGIIVSLRNIIANFAAAFSIIFNHPVQAIEALFLSLFNFIVGIVESAAKMIDTLLDTDLASAVAGFKGKVQTKIDTIVEGAGGEKAKTINAADYQIKGIDYGKAWDKGYSAGQKVDNKVSDVIGSFGDIKNLVSDGGAAVGAGSEAASSLGAGNEAASGLGAGSDGLGDIAKNTGNAAAAGNTTAANTGKIADSMENAEENLEWIKDIAEREIIDRTVFSKVEVNMGGIANNVNNMTDLDAIPAYINTALQQQLAIGAEG